MAVACRVRVTSVLGACLMASACHSAPPPAVASSPSPAPAATPDPQPEPGPASDTGPSPESTDVPEAPAAAPEPKVADKDDPVPAIFGLPLPPGHYTFPDGLRVRFTTTHECEYDSMAPCSPFDVIAWFKGKEGKANILTGKSARLVGHSVQVTEDQSLVVRR